MKIFLRVNLYCFTVAFLHFLFSNNCFSQHSKTTNKFEHAKAFIENKGQFDGRNWQKNLKIEYAIDYNGFFIFFNRQGLTYRFDKIIRNPNRKSEEDIDREGNKLAKRTNISELINVAWLGSNENAELSAQDKADYYFTYDIKKPNSKEVSYFNNINGYNKLTYKNLYNKIDVDYEIDSKKGIEYTLYLHPGADLSKVKMRYEKFHTNIKSEFINYSLASTGDFIIKSSLGEITELKPYAYYKDNRQEVKIKFKFVNDILSFDIENYDNSRELIIDPWIVSSTFNSSTAVWEVETDGIGNVYIIGGETPMILEKYTSAGSLIWTHSTPWDTATVWLGTLATDNAGISYITSGTAPEMQKVNNAGGTVWTQTGPSGLGGDAEWWSITFNCDKSKLIVGGTTLEMFPSFNAYATIFNMDILSGNVLSSQNLAYTDLSGFGATPIEVRSISSSKNAKYVFLTHEDVGAINQNIGACPNNIPVFQVDNNHHLGYKCENYLPATQNGGGLKALVANDLFFYTHSGDKIRKRSLSNGALIATVNLPGGANQTDFFGNIVVECSGLAVDNCGNIYAGSVNNIVKFDADLNVLAQSPVGFTVYDVSVNSNGEVIAVGAQSDNSATNRNGKIQAVNMTACAQYILMCCDANICPVTAVCSTDPAFTLTSSTSGGTWSGTGITNASTGLFNPATAGAGSHTIYYTLACGMDSTVIVVNACATLNVCQETNGTITVSNGTGPYTWEQYNPASTTPITNQTECEACGGSWTPFVDICMVSGVPVTDCDAPASWGPLATGTNITPSGVWPIRVTDASSNTTTINNMASLPNCSGCPALTITTSALTGTCSGQSNGSFSVSTSGGTGPYDYTLINGSGTTVATFNNIAGAQSFTNLAAGTYTLNVTDNNTCPGTTTITIATLANPTPTISGPTTICSGNTATLDAGSGYTAYSWSTGDVTQTINVTTANTYIVTVTNASGCTGTAQITVSIAANLTPTITGPTTICSGNTATLDAGSGYSTYTWSTGAVIQTINVTTANTYIVTVTNASGCTGTAQITVSIAANLTPTITGPASICSGNAVLDAGAGYSTYSWSTGASTQTITVSTANTYSVTVTNGAGCTGNTSATLTVSEPMNVYAHGTDPACGSTCNGTLDVDVTGGVGPYTYVWSGGMGTSASVTNVCSGTYTVTITDANGCTSAASVVPTSCFEIQSILVDACSVDEGFQEMVFFQVGPNPVNTSALSVNWATANSWTGVCTEPAFVTNVNATITGGGQLVEPVGGVIPAGANVVLITSTALTQSFNSFADLTGTLYVIFQCNTIVNSGHFTNYSATPGIRTLSMTFGAGCADTVSYEKSDLVTTAGIPGGEDGAYVNFSYNGTSAYENYGCVAPFTLYTTSVTLNSSSTMSTSITPTNATCGNTDGSADLTVTGGTAPLTFLWSNGAVTEDISGLAAGIYHVTITDAGACSFTDSVSITQPTTITSSIIGTNVSCNGGTNGIANLTVSGATAPITYQWSNTDITEDISNLSAGTYHVTINDATGCSAQDSIVITQPAAITATITGTNIVCSSASIGAANLSVSGGLSPYTFLWSNGAITQNISGLNAGTYSVTVTDNTTGTPSANVVANGDFENGNIGFSSDYTYSSDLGPTGNYYIGPNSNLYNPGFCTYSDHTTGAGDFLNVNGAGTPNTDVWCQSIIVNPNTLYNFSAWVSSLNPNSPALLQFSINGFTMGNIFSAPSVCDVWQQFQSTWNSGSNTTASICILNQNSTASGNDFGIDDITFNAVGTGCTSNASIIITQTNAISSSITPTAVLCNGNSTGAANLTVTGGNAPLTYSWSDGSTTEDLTNVAAGTYSVTATDTNLCVTTANTTITQPAQVSVTLSATNIQCNGINTGSITSTTTGGVSPYTYIWSNGAVTQNLSNIGTGSYTVTVKDVNNCIATSNVSITQPAAITIQISSQTNVNCNGGSNGSVTVTVNGGTSPYSYSWPNNQTAATATNLTAGNYIVTVTDANNCTATLNVTITEQTSLTASIIGTNILCAGTSTGSANLTVSGGGLPYTYLWSNGFTTEDLTNLATGTYIVTTTDAQNCSVTDTIIITSQSALTVSTNTSTNVSCNSGSDGTASLNVSGGTIPYSYSWAANTSLNSNSINILHAGNNYVTVSDGNNCFVIYNVILTEPAKLSLTTSANTIICNGASATMTALATGGTQPYSYFWNNQPGGFTNTISPVSDTIYNVYVIDANGCTSAIKQINIGVYPPVNIQADCLNNNICMGDSAQIFVTASQGNAPYIITDSNGIVLNTLFYLHPAQTLQYIVNVTDNCNSTASDSVLINVYPAPLIDINFDKYNGCTPLLVQFYETSLNAGQSYLWNFGSPDENNLSLSKNPTHLFDVPGSYDISISVTSAYGCKSDAVYTNLIEVYPVPDARFTYAPSISSIINPFISFTNYSTGNIENYWFFGDGDSSIEVNPNHLYNQIGSYPVTLVAVTDKNCTDTVIEIVKIIDITTFYAPSAFSPDKDSKNDIFKVFASGIEINNFQLMIYDRWGELIFKSEDIQKGWDGKVNGEISQMGTYAWIAIYKDFSGNQKTQVGKVTLIR